MGMQMNVRRVLQSGRMSAFGVTVVSHESTAALGPRGLGYSNWPAPDVTPPKKALGESKGSVSRQGLSARGSHCLNNETATTETATRITTRETPRKAPTTAGSRLRAIALRHIHTLHLWMCEWDTASYIVILPVPRCAHRWGHLEESHATPLPLGFGFGIPRHHCR